MHWIHVINIMRLQVNSSEVHSHETIPKSILSILE